MADTHGKPLKTVTERTASGRPKHAFVFIIDGCRADTLYNALDSGQMPYLKRFMDEVGFVRYSSCFTVFPSVTVACHASIVTGAYPGAHGIVGNNWFIRKKWGNSAKNRELFRATREYVKYSWKHPKSDPGLMNGLFTDTYFSIANSDLYHAVSTLYEACCGSSTNEERRRSMSVLEMISRGADEHEYIDFDDVSVIRGMIYNGINRLWAKIRKKEVLSYPNNLIDWRAFDNLVHALRRRKEYRPETAVIWLPGMDGFSHANGAAHQSSYFKKRSWFTELFIGSVDKQFRRLYRLLKRQRRLDDVLIAITADHGQYTCESRETISVEDIYRHLMSDPDAAEGETFPVNGEGEVDEECRDATVVLSQNGGGCFVYVKSANGWGTLPEPERLLKFCRPLSKLKSTDRIFVRNCDREYRLWEDGELKPLSCLDKDEYPLAEERICSLAHTARSGDILLTAKMPAYYEGKPLKGEHGSIHREDSSVPLIFIGSGLDNSVDSESDTRIIDIVPTVASVMGYSKELSKKGTRYDKLHYILDALQAKLKSRLFRKGSKYTLRKIGKSLNRERVKRDWYVDEEDMRENFEAKAEAYRKKGYISAGQYAELYKRYGMIMKKTGVRIQTTKPRTS